MTAPMMNFLTETPRSSPAAALQASLREVHDQLGALQHDKARPLLIRTTAAVVRADTADEPAKRQQLLHKASSYLERARASGIAGEYAAGSSWDSDGELVAIFTRSAESMADQLAAYIEAAFASSAKRFTQKQESQSAAAPQNLLEECEAAWCNRTEVADEGQACEQCGKLSSASVVLMQCKRCESACYCSRCASAEVGLSDGGCPCLMIGRVWAAIALLAMCAHVVRSSRCGLLMLSQHRMQRLRTQPPVSARARRRRMCSAGSARLQPGRQATSLSAVPRAQACGKAALFGARWARASTGTCCSRTQTRRRQARRLSHSGMLRACACWLMRRTPRSQTRMMREC